MRQEQRRRTSSGLPAFLSLMLPALTCHAEVLTLNEAVSLALNGNREVQVAELEIAKTQSATAEIRTQRLPQFRQSVLGGASLTPVKFSVPGGAFGTYPAVGPIPGTETIVAQPRSFNGIFHGLVAQPLTQLRKVNLAARESRLGEESAAEGFRQKKSDTALQVKQVYFQIVHTQAQVSTARDYLRYLVELSALTERNLAQEAVLRSDSLSVKAQLSQQRYQIMVLEDSLVTEKEALNRLLGRDVSTDFSVEIQPQPEVEAIEIAMAQKVASEQRAEIRQARIQSEKAEIEVKRERAEYLPDVSLQLSYTGLPNMSFAPKNLLTAGIKLEWQPFDWGQKKHKIEQLRSAARQSALTMQDVRQQIKIDVNQKLRKLTEARALLDAQAAMQETEREKLRVVTNRYGERAALFADLLQQQALVTQADSQYQQALAALWSAKADFDHALGRE